jgi:hypothetical protein
MKEREREKGKRKVVCSSDRQLDEQVVTFGPLNSSCDNLIHLIYCNIYYKYNRMIAIACIVSRKHEIIFEIV